MGLVAGRFFLRGKPDPRRFFLDLVAGATRVGSAAGVGSSRSTVKTLAGALVVGSGGLFADFSSGASTATGWEDLAGDMPLLSGAWFAPESASFGPAVKPLPLSSPGLILVGLICDFRSGLSLTTAAGDATRVGRIEAAE